MSIPKGVITVTKGKAVTDSKEYQIKLHNFSIFMNNRLHYKVVRSQLEF